MYIALKAILDTFDSAPEIVFVLCVGNLKLIVHELESAGGSRTLSIHNVAARLTEQQMRHSKLCKVWLFHLKGIRKVHWAFRRRGDRWDNVVIAKGMTDESGRISRNGRHMGLNVPQQLKEDTHELFSSSGKERLENLLAIASSSDRPHRPSTAAARGRIWSCKRWSADCLDLYQRTLPQAWVLVL